jgi:hypothetical protein
MLARTHMASNQAVCDSCWHSRAVSMNRRDASQGSEREARLIHRPCGTGKKWAKIEFRMPAAQSLPGPEQVVIRLDLRG